MKIKLFLKKNIKIVVAFILGLIISGSSVYAATVTSSSVSYNAPTGSGLSDNVQDALDGLYGKANHYYTLGKSATEFVDQYVDENKLAYKAFCSAQGYSDAEDDNCVKSSTTCRITINYTLGSCGAQYAGTCPNTCITNWSGYGSCMSACQGTCYTECESQALKDETVVACRSNCYEQYEACQARACTEANAYTQCLSAAQTKCANYCGDNEYCTSVCVEKNKYSGCKD